MRMLVRQNKYYNNLKNIDTNDYDDIDKEYGYFYDLDINDNAILIEKIQLCENPQNNIINNYCDRYYIYNSHDQKKMMILYQKKMMMIIMKNIAIYILLSM